VLRVRASKGIRISAYHGNFFVRSTDLLSVPNVNPDNAYTIQIALDENLTSQTACFQTALLYTTSYGEHRIRVLTTTLPITNDISTLFRGVNSPAMATLLAKMAVERVFTAKLEDARDALVNKMVEILGAYRRWAAFLLLPPLFLSFLTSFFFVAALLAPHRPPVQFRFQRA